MMLNVLKRQKIELAGMDIGTSAVKMVCLNRTEDGYVLVNAAAEQIIPCQDDEPQQRKNIIAAVRACLQKTNWKNKNIVCGVSGPEVIVRGFTFPPIPDQAVEQAVRMEAQQVCPLDLKQSVLDYQLIGVPQAAKAPKARPRAGVMTVGTERVIQDRTDLLAQAGAKAIMVDVNALAVLNCLNELRLLDERETVAVIDVGSTMSHVVIYGHDGLPFVRDIHTAGTQIARQMAEELQISQSRIWQMLAQNDASEELDRDLLLAVNHAIAPLATAINETLRFYSFQEKRAGVDRIFLCGGLAMVGSFLDLLTDALSVPVQVLNPFTKITCSGDVQKTEGFIKDGPVFVIATGLAMRTV